MTEPLLSVRDLTKHYPITEGVLRREVGRTRAVDGVSFDLYPGETLGLVGESGCGKSTTATTVLRLEEPTSGEVRFDGEDVTSFDKRELKRFRRRVQMIFQDPTSSLDPRMTVGESIAEPLRVHGMADRDRRRRIVRDLLERVGLSADDIDRYPHEFSGGQKQRIALARALVVNPDLLVADEPVSALDVSIKADILSLLGDVQAAFGLSILFISHDMSVVREVCDRVAVMYLGEIVELAPTDELYGEPLHPYTEALLAAIPEPDPRRRGGGVELTGDVPDPAKPPAGCRFHTRCPDVIHPEGYDLSEAEWQGLVRLRHRLETGELDPDALRESAAGPGDSGASAPDRELRSAVRGEFDLPGTLSDPNAETVLADALDAVVAGDDERALALFADAFSTPCREHHPELLETDAPHPVACHLHNDYR